jgi:pSer/pThr/pTyr-binding forkhead associated (FHA) protein
LHKKIIIKNKENNTMITCTACGYDQNPDNTEFCNACGSELQTVPTLQPKIEPVLAPTVIQPTIPEPNYPPIIPDPPTITNTFTIAKLTSKQTNAPIPEFIIDNNAIVGIFDSDTGPVEIDLETFFGGETVSRNHAEIYQELGTWKVKDLGSTNGVFIKPKGQTRFSARITVPTSLNSGDEIAFGKVRFHFQTI